MSEDSASTVMLYTFISQYGLIALGLLIFLESAGLPVPGETLLLAAGAAAARGVLSIEAVIAVAAAAAILGDSMGYWIGQRYGLALLTRYGRWLRITPAHLAHAQAFFVRHGPKTVFLGRFIAVLRVLAAVFAGVSQMRYRVFLAYNALGGLVWAVVIGLLGYQFGQQLPVVEYVLRQAGVVLAGLASAALLGLISWRWLARHQAAVQTRLDYLGEWLAQRRSVRALAQLRIRHSVWVYLGIHLSSGFAISLLLLLSTRLADQLMGSAALTQFNLQMAASVHATATPLTTRAMVAATAFGGPLLLAIGLSGALVLAVRRNWSDLLLWLGTLGGGAALSIVRHALTPTVQPRITDLVSADARWSVLNSHGMLALMVYGLLAYLLVSRIRSWRWQLATILAVGWVIALIGFSRLYLGIHSLSDLVAGDVAGLGWLLSCASAHRAVGAAAVPGLPAPAAGAHQRLEH